MRAGRDPELLIRFQFSAPQRLPLDHIAEFVTEEGNPHNTRHVAEVELFISSPLLGEGVTLVGTPGVGSLATSGTAHAMAYLPRCDLGAVLVDAGSSLNHEDLAVIQGLHETAIPAAVLVSKADLLAPDDRLRFVRYVERRTSEQLGMLVRVFPVSTRGADVALTDAWMADYVQPLLANHGEAARASLRRKTANPRELVVSTLASQLDRARGAATRLDAARLADAEEKFEAASKHIGRIAEQICLPINDGLPEIVRDLIGRAASDESRGGPAGECPLRDLVIESMARAVRAARDELIDLHRTLMRTLEELATTLSADACEPMESAERVLQPLPAASEKDLGEIPNVRASRLLAWCPRLASWSLRRRLQREAYWPAHAAFSDYRQKLRAWTRTNMQKVAGAFESAAGPYRERLRLERGAARPSVDLERLQADLHQLLARSSIERGELPRGDGAEGSRRCAARRD